MKDTSKNAVIASKDYKNAGLKVFSNIECDGKIVAKWESFKMKPIPVEIDGQTEFIFYQNCTARDEVIKAFEYFKAKAQIAKEKGDFIYSFYGLIISKGVESYWNIVLNGSDFKFVRVGGKENVKIYKYSKGVIKSDPSKTEKPKVEKPKVEKPKAESKKKVGDEEGAKQFWKEYFEGTPEEIISPETNPLLTKKKEVVEKKEVAKAEPKTSKKVDKKVEKPVGAMSDAERIDALEEELARVKQALIELSKVVKSLQK